MSIERVGFTGDISKVEGKFLEGVMTPWKSKRGQLQKYVILKMEV